eukprot:ANDGO_02198.mRNA.1 hypothetical protein
MQITSGAPWWAIAAAAAAAGVTGALAGHYWNRRCTRKKNAGASFHVYIPSVYDASETDPQLWQEIVEKNPFVLVVSTDSAGHTHLTQIPVIAVGDRLVGHLAGDNQHAALLSASPDPSSAHRILVFGPHAFVPSGVYKTQPQVSTWDYITCHLDVTATRVSSNRATLETLAQHFEPSFQWHDYASALQNDVHVYEFRVTKATIIRKMSQNKTDENILAVKSYLVENGQADVAAYVTCRGAALPCSL